MANTSTPSVYNILPIHDLLADHPSLQFPEVRSSMDALRNSSDLRKPPGFHPTMDLLDWLGLYFGFQADNVRNQREHLVLLLANAQMRLYPPPDNLNVLDFSVVHKLHKKLLRNYNSWCAFLSRPSSIWTSSDTRRELLYSALYLLIWGEAANLRFMPECLCYLFHHMAMELNKILEDYTDSSTGAPFRPYLTGHTNGFLLKVVKPIYDTIKAEVDSSKNGTEPYSAWRNYDDINEYFWSNRCFERLGWPIDLSRNFFIPLSERGVVGKTGFVEQRSFWNLFRSFDRLWIMLFLFLQAAIIAAWDERKSPWQGFKERDTQARLLTVFITWSVFRLLQSVLDFVSQFKLVSRETPWLFVRMVLKTVAAATWTCAFSILYAVAWARRHRDRRWSPSANSLLINFLEAAAVFVLPEALALLLFIIPWVRNYLENSNLKFFYILTWWFQTRAFVGRGLRESTVDNIKYTLFWILVLGVKFTFSYILQVRPMIAPTKSLLSLRDVDFHWPHYLGDSNRFAVGVIWLPVVLIYLMDISIWYAIFSSAVGALVGLFSHIGEIRNVHQLRLRFQFFASAMQFNLLPEEQVFNTWGGIKGRFSDMVLRLKLRYGLGRPYKKIDSSQVQTTRFTLIWNEIIEALREEDIVSDRDIELLELPSNSWGIRVIRWPCFLLSNELSLALGQAEELGSPDKRLWKKISKNLYRKCAVIEAYDSIKFVLVEILKGNSQERSIISSIFNSIDEAIHFEKFTQEYKIKALPKLRAQLLLFLKLLIEPGRDKTKLVNTLQTLYDIAVKDFPVIEKTMEEKRHIGWAPRSMGLLFEDAIELPGPEDRDFYRQLRRLHTIITSNTMSDVPNNIEARRRIAFFSNSIFMSMPRAPQVEKMLPFSVLTPYYKEEVLYSREELEAENEDGVTMLYYLRTIYSDEWKNFKERIKRQGLEEGSDFRRELRLWASHRGQTLTRTVRGMMYYYRAIKMLAFLDSASEIDIREESRELVNVGPRETSSAPSPDLSRADSGNGSMFRGHEYGIALMKYTYVVACQLYGSQKAKKDRLAEEILNLMKNNEALRVAYVDEVIKERSEMEYYSVLVKYDHSVDREVEVYRVRLPGPMKLGEGKPENQNHALIFTRGDAIQTIDMNQDNYFEEALKMRNLLEEFGRKYGSRKPTILGVREHIFTGSVSSLAKFMSAQETSFVTLGQRVLANPLKVRMHYGHPDVFDRIWFLTRGGVSKASRVINISEDIFAGFNCTLRGGNVTHHEYIQVGKGRDVGLNQISLFEAKVASGNGEQVASRDVYRLGHRLDFFRMLSFYYTTVGFFFNTMIVVLTVYAFVWGRLYLSLSGIETSITDSTANNAALGSILNQQFIIQLGIFTALPMIIENSLELGFLAAIFDFIKMQLQLASVFYSFSMGTRTHYFGRTILHGGASYQATGRGFVVAHKSFCENYRLYARSHFVKAIELGLILTIYASYSPVSKNTFVYIVLTISSWFLVVSWIMAPFFFNPSGFDLLKTVKDFENFMDWIWFRGVFAKSDESWETWWNDEQKPLKTTGLLGKLFEIVLDLRFFFFQFGIVYQLRIAHGSSSIAVYLLSWIGIALAVGVFVTITYAKQKYSEKEHIYYRAVQAFVIVLTVLAIILLLKLTHFGFVDIFTSLLAFLPTGWGIILIAQVVRTYVKSTFVWEAIVMVARLYEILIAVIVVTPVAILSWAPGFQFMQTRILFNEAFSRGLQISHIILGTKSTSDAQAKAKKSSASGTGGKEKGR